MTKTTKSLFRKPAFAALALFATIGGGGVAHATDVIMFRSPSCGCCLAWLDHMRGFLASAGEQGELRAVSHPNMTAFKDEKHVPRDLRSCHTSIIEGYVIEGHVPAADIARLLEQRPEGIAGLAVAGMPVGSPGMEYQNRLQPYQVIAFGPKGRQVWASYPLKAS